MAFFSETNRAAEPHDTPCLSCAGWFTQNVEFTLQISVVIFIIPSTLRTFVLFPPYIVGPRIRSHVYCTAAVTPAPPHSAVRALHFYRKKVPALTFFPSTGVDLFTVVVVLFGQNLSGSTRS